MKATENDYKTGWYEREKDDQGPFRWMAQHATVAFEGQELQGQNYLRIIAGRLEFGGSCGGLASRAA